MKRINIKNILPGCAIASAALMLGSCTGEFEKWNINPNEATEEQMGYDNLNTGAYLSQMERGVFIVGTDMGGEYQITQMLEGDIFASYIAPITSWSYAPTNNDHYNLYQGWYNAPFKDAYTNVMQPWKAIYDVTEQGAPARALASIVKVFGMHRITDMYGPIPYSKFGTAVKTPYDSQKDVYYQFFNELDTAVNTLTTLSGQGISTLMEEYDYVYSGNITKWIKFANTLRLRLAMRISNVDESKAREEAEKAIGNSAGLMASSSDDALLHQGTRLTYRNPIWEVSESFNDMRMSATMDCYLNGYSDPRLTAYFRPTEDDGEYHGARNGMTSINKDSYTNSTSGINFESNSDLHWMHASEAFFLMAEAKLRWGLGDKSAKEYYEEGVKASFSTWGVSGADAYLADSESKPLTEFSGSNRSTDTSEMLSQLSPAWEEGDDSKNLERIALQHWISCFPDGQEAWSNMRRTGYPGWVRIQSYDYQTEVAENEMISRLKFPTTEYSDNTDNTTAAVQLLGGKDSAGTRLWWDVKR